MIPLGARSHYSWRLGTASPGRLVQHARTLGFTHLGLTDRDNLCGLWPFLRACEEQGVTPIVGAEVTEPGPAAQRRRAFCLVENDEGYRSLCRLLSARARVGFSLQRAVQEHGQGLCVLTENADDLQAWHEAGVTVAAGLGCKLEDRNHQARVRARRLGVPLVALLDNVGLQPRDHALHRVLRAIAGNTEFSWLDAREVFPPDAFFASPTMFARRFEACPEAMAGTQWVAERCTFRRPAHGLVLPPYADAQGRSSAEVLREQAYAGAAGRYGDDLSEVVVERLNYELGRIEEKGFSSYFLVVRDIVRRSPRICGRGSGAASLVAYCLGITNVCPIRHNLYFERFLNPARQDPPDIDVDFAWDERDAVIDSVLAEHGCRAAMVSSHVLFQPRMAIREVAKVFGLPDGEISRVVGRLPWFWREDNSDEGLLACLEKMPELKFQEFPQPWPEILQLAEALIGIPRHISVHPGGTIITPRPIEDYVPVEMAPKGVPIIQWDKDGAEDGGLVKIDLLGNRSLAVIRDAVANLRENGLTLDEATWEPEKDTDTMRAVARGLTMGCFYIESPAMRLLQQKAGMGDFEHLVIHSSIIRPAANVYINEYLRRLKGGAWKPIHPLLVDVLDETFGIMVYQEDVSKAAVAMAGFSHSDADALRKILSKRDRAQRLADWRLRFAAGARAHGVDDAAIEEVWAMMMSFDGYSFCKPHSASYARVSFQAAYLKVHFPAEMMAAVLSNQGGFYSAFAYVSEARRMGIQVQAPDVNASQVTWRGHGHNLRVALQAVSALSAEAARQIVDTRAARPYTC
ncbi:MAG TPA: DNA polymerase III subunit alpha, partial [Polyangia bacterium]